MKQLHALVIRQLYDRSSLSGTVFLKLAEGRSVNDIAASFCLSPSTVGTHLYHIKQKLNVSNASELTLVALRNGLLEA